MTRTEGSRGIEALGILPFREAVFDRDRALTTLTPITYQVLQKNCRADIDYLKTHTPQAVFPIQRRQQIADHPESFLQPGGLSLSIGELDRMYSEGLTFQQQTEKIMRQTAAELIPPDPNRTRNPGIKAINYFNDLLRILNPDIAKYEEGVEMILRSLRKNGFFTFPMLGAMIDDTINRRSDAGYPDFLADTEGAEQFMGVVLNTALPHEQAEIQYGISVPREVLLDEVMRLRATEN